MRLLKIAPILALTACLAAGQTPAISDAGKTALSHQLAGAVSRGDTPGVVGYVVSPDGVLYEGAAGSASEFESFRLHR